MTDHKVVSSEEWTAAREELLAREKEHTRLGDELAGKRRELPWVQVEKEYRFETEEGTKSLADLFEGRSQLLVYHFMFGPSYEAGCPVCSSIADTLAPQVATPGGKGHDSVARFSRAAREAPGLQGPDGLGRRLGLERGQRLQPRPRLLYTEEELKPFLEGEIPPTVEQNARMCGTDVLGYVSEGPGLSAYALSDGIVYRTYVTTARGLEPAMAYYALLDRTPKGRHEDPRCRCGSVATTSTEPERR